MIRPELTVAAVIERDGRFLTVEEWVSGRRVYNQPAGHVEPGESGPTAVRRETLEETGWHLTPQALIGLYHWPGDGQRPDILRAVYTGAVRAPAQPPRLDDGIIAAHWLTRAELAGEPQRLRSPLVLRAIDDYLAGHRHPPELFSMLDAPTHPAPDCPA